MRLPVYSKMLGNSAEHPSIRKHLLALLACGVFQGVLLSGPIEEMINVMCFPRYGLSGVDVIDDSFQVGSGRPTLSITGMSQIALHV